MNLQNDKLRNKNLKNKILVAVVSSIFFSCSSLSYNYTQYELAQEYNKTVKYFDRVVSVPIRKSDLKKLEKRFTFLKKQLHKNNDNYERLNETTVRYYDEKMDEYLMFVRDLKD